MPGLSDHSMEESLGPDSFLKKSTGESKPGLSYPTVVPLLVILTALTSLSVRALLEEVAALLYVGLVNLKYQKSVKINRLTQ